MRNATRPPTLVRAPGLREETRTSERQMHMTDYKSDLSKRFWEYQRAKLTASPGYFDRPQADDGRPPVLIPSEASRNVINKPDATQEETDRLLALVPEADRHKWFRSFSSSQALAQSVLGNLAVHGLLHCLAELHTDEGEPILGNSDLLAEHFTMEYKLDYLGEPRPTSLDAYISGGYRVAIECKFTEGEFGPCSRPRMNPKDPNFAAEHCSGDYSRQLGRKDRCALTGIGVLYWRYVPQLFAWGGESDLSPCPLNRNYQAVRNVLAVEVRPDKTVSTHDGHALLIYDERNPAFQEGGAALAAYAETRAALREPAMLRRCSWQRIVSHVRQTGVMPWLVDELALKYGM